MRAFKQIPGLSVLLGTFLFLSSQVEAVGYRILVAYTPVAGAAMPTALRDYIEDYVIDYTNYAYGNSPSSGQVMPTVELAGITEVSYTESSNINTDLERFRTTSDGYMDGIHHLRTIYAADIVMLIFTGGGATVSCPGLGDCQPPNGGIGADAAFSFFIADFDPYFPQYVVAHEIGHLFGCRHGLNRPHPYPSPHPDFSDSYTTPYVHGHGYFDTIPGSPPTYFGDIMAAPSQYRQPWFSNPNRVHPPTFLPRGNSTYANCAQVHHDRRTAIEGFKSPSGSPVMSGQVIADQQYADVVGTNVSTSGTVTFESGSEGKLRATGSVEINPGFSVEAGAKLTVLVGASALAKSSTGGTSSPPGSEVQVPGPVEFSFQAKAARNGGLDLNYALPENAPVSLMVLRLNGEVVRIRNLGSQSAGRYAETFGIGAVETGLYLVSLKAGNRTVSRKVYLGR